ncbi:HAMP domain-containing sensor histidine kinase [Neobacillus sp. YX16]|uniref:HAMP domain-containing sensor histidine kinase n=1 Tax=Neobacillus sp. YX16 TaxID=3047874 RepID=UPI0024C2EBB1|nr:HAMP domain-containing sensor histidine kinase [Neobacillus sp. YX16]WHZ03569.1 HAMP domain-containing sensor histidine kinase [Neobacillus sp. YX16]
MKSLYGKFALTTIFIMVLSGVLSFVISNLYYQHSLKPQNDDKITNFALEISKYIQKDPNINLNNYLNHIGLIGYQIYIVNDDGVEQFFGNAYRDTTLSKKAMDTVIAGEIYHGINQFPHKTFVTGFFANELKNTVGVPFTYQQRKFALFIRPDIKLMFNEMHLLFAWLLLTSILLSILFVLIGSKFLVNPVVKLNQATKILSEGNFTIHLDINRKDEIGDLAGSFMNMSRKLEKVDKLRKEFISNVSHDIQSPLTNIKGYLNLLDDEGISKEKRQNYIKVIHSEINRLSNLSKQLLLLSSIESKKELIDVKEFDVAEQIKSVIQQFSWRINERELMLSYSLPETKMTGDPFLLYSVWENLLTNAIKYNVENGSIDIIVTSLNDYIEVQFKDSGIGLESSQIERIYDRFYRADPSRSKAVEGTGLGLSIVQSIVQLHRGKIVVESVKDIGTNFTVILPK